VVYSEERKFLVPIPTFSGVPLVYPPEHEFAGKTIQYQREGAQGVRWWNSITNEWQGVASDDTGVIIINQVTEPEALQLQQWLTDKVGDPSKLYAKVVLDFINFAKEQTAHCVYNATRQDFLRTVDPLKWPGQTGWAAYGLHQRKKDDLYRAVLVQQPFIFEPAGNQFFPEGCVLICSISSQKMRCVLSKSFETTYRLESGDRVQLAELPMEDV